MTSPPRPVNEEGRLAALAKYATEGSLLGEALSDLTALAALVCDAPMAAVSLVDGTVERVVSRIGLPSPEMPRPGSFGDLAILRSELAEIKDTTRDARTATHPWVTGDPHIRFFAGAPLITPDGHAIGAVGVMDRVPRALTTAQSAALRLAAEQVMMRLVLEHQAAEIEESEARLLKVFHNCPVALSISRSEDRTFVDVNAAFTQLLGWSRDEVIGRSASDLNIADVAVVTAFRARLAARGNVRDEELPVRTRDGDSRIVLIGTNLLPLRGTAHVITTFVDITARKQVELSSNRIAAIVESSDDAIIGKDLTGRVTSWNRGAESIFGYTAAEMIGQSIMAIIPADRQDEEREILDTVKHGQGVKHLETSRRTKDGRLIDVSITTSPIRDANGDVVGVSKIARDISEQRKAEASRRALQARYRALFEHAPDGIVIANAESYYLDANASICRMLGYTRDELVGLHASDIVVPAEIEHIGPALTVITGGGEYHREWLFRRTDGSVFPAEVISTKLPDGNLLGMIRDITERRNLEQQILRAQRLESIGTLAGGIAHDLNNVLAPILMSISLLKGGLTDPGMLEVLDMMDTSARRGRSLVQQVLSFARGVEGHHTTLEPAELVRELLRVLRDTFPKSIDVRLDAAEGLWPITGDATQIHQVLLNLCVNARDAMPTGGQLTITIENIVLDETYAAMNLDSIPGAYVMLGVTDTGTGMRTDVRERIFEPFFTTKGVGEGTGLGLSTTLGIVKSHGGFIHVYSEVGAGTTFKVYLPTRSADLATVVPVAATAPLPRGNGEVILVVDDEVAIRVITKRTLEEFGYQVMLAANGAEAVAVYAQHPTIAAVITDMAMPVMDGITTIVALRSLNPRIPVICSSGVASEETVAKAVGVGAQRFVAKPYTAETILTALHELVHGDG